jgi:hypothetical protein
MKNKVTNWNNIIVHYSDDSSEESNVNDLLANESNKFKGWLCWAGLQNITIDSDGNVWRAICKVGGKLGDIHNGFDVPTEPIICTKDSCNCAADIQLSKAEPGSIKKLRIGNTHGR